MTEPLKSPAELRNMFGENLKTLARNAKSISLLSRQLGINRTQFNRYLSGESFPRPDVLARICRFFEVDARILLEPVSQIKNDADPLTSQFLSGFLGHGVDTIDEDEFPTGFYRFSFVFPKQLLGRVLHAYIARKHHKHAGRARCF